MIGWRGDREAVVACSEKHNIRTFVVDTCKIFNQTGQTMSTVISELRSINHRCMSHVGMNIVQNKVKDNALRSLEKRDLIKTERECDKCVYEMSWKHLTLDQNSNLIDAFPN